MRSEVKPGVPISDKEIRDVLKGAAMGGKIEFQVG